jgi:hypothetical protein
MLTSVVALAFLYAGAPSVELKKPTVDAYKSYVAAAEKQVDAELAGSDFFWGKIPPQEEKLRAGEVLIQKATVEGQKAEVPDGLVHHWSGFVFIPKANLSQLLTFLEDYDHHQDYYKPEVARSKLLRRDGDHFVAHLRFVKKKVITVVLNTEHDVRYFRVDPTRAHSRSHTTKINEVEKPNEAGEREKPEGQGAGFLWRMDTYWRFLEKDGGVYVRCDALSLTRDIPIGLGWLIGPFVTSIPKDSLSFTLNSTRTALAKR